ncbi:IS4 family transposase [Paenibacillus sonchi]
MDNIPKMTVIRQCLSLLPTLSPTCVPLDYGVKKLRTLALLQLSVTAHLLRWESYREYAWQLDASPDLQELLGLPSISASQVSRRMNQLPTALLEHLFYALTHLIKNLSRPASSGLLQRVGRLLLVDASCLKLPAFLSDWARVTRDRCGVKIHVSYAVTSPEHTFVQHMVPSTGNVSDYEGSDLLLHEEEVTYVLDRGYVCYERMDRWIEGGLNFVMRIADHHQANVLHEHPVPEGSRILRDATVQMGSGYTAMEQRVRLVEFTDEKGRLYRIVTTQWEASAEDIAEIYKHRWLIELFFKWLKQHLRLVRLQSTQPQGI